MFAVLRLSRRFHVALHRARHFRLTFGACDHVTFELHNSDPEFDMGGGGQFKTSKRILQNLGNVRKRNDLKSSSFFIIQKAIVIMH